LLSFPPFRFDPAEERLWKNDRELRVRRKPFAILKHFVENPRKLITHDELVVAVWGKVAMSESLVRTHVRDLRQALGEDLIETVVGRGYRFLADLSEVERAAPVSAAELDESDDVIVARGAELDVLDLALHCARDGRRAVVFLTGDPGIGKTSLVDAFIERSRAASLVVARGACVEQYGGGEAFLPILEALGNLCRARGGERVIETLMRHAPTWLAQMPGLVPPARFEELQRRVTGAAQARMLREIIEALEALAAEAPVLLTLDDLQWSDPSTLDFVAMLAHRREPARIVVVATYRASELLPGSPLARVTDELVAHRQATCVHLQPFDEQAVAAYLAKRFQNHRFPGELTTTIHRTTGGNPLFVVTILEDLASRELIAKTDEGWTLTTEMERVAAQRPDSIRRLIDTQIDRLGTTEQRILEAASVAGATFTADAVAHALDAQVDEIDASCEALAEERRLLQLLGTETWPNGTIHTQYGFRHALFQDAARARTPSSLARLWHRRIAERLEAAHAGSEEEIAAELALHFVEARAFVKAAPYSIMAAEREAKRHAHREARAHLERANVLMAKLPHEHGTQMLEYRVASGLARCIFVTDGLTAPGYVRAIDRAVQLATSIGDDLMIASALLELFRYHILNGDFRAAAELEGRATAAAERASEPLLKSASWALASVTDLHLGRFSTAVEHLARARVGGGDIRDSELAAMMSSVAALIEWFVGHPDAAIAEGERGVLAAEGFGDPFWIGNALCALGCLQVWRGDADGAESSAQRALVLAAEAGLPWITERAQPILLWAHAERDAAAAAEMDGWLARPDAGRMGRTLQSAVFALACTKVGRAELAQVEITEALAIASQSEERFVEAELHRLRGEVLAATDTREAESSFAQAIEIAQKQGSVALELRATLSLHRHAKGPRSARLKERIAQLVESHTGGESTRDLRDAARV
jgi:DNA-binding winged helix-turn-helix (wHTH) protein